MLLLSYFYCFSLSRRLLLLSVCGSGWGLLFFIACTNKVWLIGDWYSLSVQRPAAAPVAPPAGGVPGDPEDVRGLGSAQGPHHRQHPHPSPGDAARLPHHTGVLAGQGHRPLTPPGGGTADLPVISLHTSPPLPPPPALPSFRSDYQGWRDWRTDEGHSNIFIIKLPKQNVPLLHVRIQDSGSTRSLDVAL